jgi:predicted Rdx family selenoprotein
MIVFCRPALESPRVAIETPAQCRMELSACWVAAMLRMTFSWWYTLSSLSAEGVGKLSRSAATSTMFCLALEKAGCYLPSWLMVAAMSLG